jgi:hypothetical protein
MLFARYSRKVSDMGVLCKNSNPTGDFRKRYDQLVTYYKTLNLLYKKSNYAVKYYQIFSKQATKKSKKSPVVEWDVKLTAVNKFLFSNDTKTTLAATAGATQWQASVSNGG